MLQDELGLPLRGPSAWRAGGSTFAAFVVIGMLPLLAFVSPLVFSGRPAEPFLTSAVLTGVALFVVGAIKSRFVEQRWHVAGLETLGIGGLAAVLAYLIGMALRNLA